MPFTHVNSSVTSHSCNTNAVTTSSREFLSLHDYQGYQADNSRPQKRQANEALSMAEEKKQRRLAKNRATASVSRSRKREHLHNLQVRLCQLEQQNAQLSEKLAQQEDELQLYRKNANAPHDTCAPVVKSEVAAVTDVGKLSEAVVLRSAASALPRIFCSTATQPAASNQDNKSKSAATAPADNRAGNHAAATCTSAINLSAPVLNRKPSRASDPAPIHESANCDKQQKTSASAAPHGAEAAADKASEDESASPSEVESHEAHQSALLSLVTAGDSTQSSFKQDPGVKTTSDSLCNPSERRADSAFIHEHLSPISMPPGSFLMPDFTQPGLTQSLDFARPFDQHQADLGQASSCDLSSIEMAAELLDASASHYSTGGVGQPLQPGTWVPLDQSSRGGSLPHGTTRRQLVEQTPAWSWPVTTGSSCMHLSSAQTATFSRMPPMPKPQEFTAWDQPAWDDSWHQQGQSTQHSQQQQQDTRSSDCAGEHEQGFLHHWQADLAPYSKTSQPSERPVTNFAESETSWWSLPSRSAKGFEA